MERGTSTAQTTPRTNHDKTVRPAASTFTKRLSNGTTLYISTCWVESASEDCLCLCLNTRTVCLVVGLLLDVMHARACVHVQPHNDHTYVRHTGAMTQTHVAAADMTLSTHLPLVGRVRQRLGVADHARAEHHLACNGLVCSEGVS